MEGENNGTTTSTTTTNGHEQRNKEINNNNNNNDNDIDSAPSSLLEEIIATSSSSSSNVITEEEVDEQFKTAKQLFNEGKYYDASQILCDVLDFKVKKYGDLGLECAPSYYYYGRSLYLSAAGTLQEKLGGAEEDDDQDDTEETESLEIAWEVLDAARVIYSKQDNCLQQLADVHNALYEVSIESGNDGIEDATKCVEITSQITPPQPRSLAVAHYTLALALFSANRKDESKVNFRKAIEILSIYISTNPPDIDEVKGVLSDLKETVAELDFSANPVPTSTSSSSKPQETTSFSQPTLLHSSNSNNNNNNQTSNSGVNNFGVVGRSIKKVAPTTTTTTTDSTPSVSEPQREKRKSDGDGGEPEKRLKTQ